MPRFTILPVLFTLLPLSGLASAAELDTGRYRIDVQTRCAEGNVTCDDVVGTATDIASGRSVTLRGETWHLPCADGTTPCRFLGYRFRNGDTSWRLHDDGHIDALRDDGATVFRAQGRWNHDR